MKHLLLFLIAFIALGASSTFAQCTPVGDASIFGTNQWNVYAYNSGDGTVAGTDWSTNYAGYYIATQANAFPGFSTFVNWNSNASPSAASGYAGCTVGNDNHSYTAKRKGFPCGYYRLDVSAHDDAAQLFVNGTKVWEHDGCCDSHTGVWSGWLGDNDKIEFRVSEGTGGSGAALDLIPDLAADKGDPTVFGNNQWNVYAFNSGNGTIAGTDWNTNYAGYYTATSLNFNSENEWGYLLSPSSAATYKGCAVSVDQMSYSARRQGFNCGYYSLDIPLHDDAAQLWVNGVKVWEHDGCCDSHTGVWSGWLGANDKVEFRISEGGGGSAGRLDFNLNATADKGNPSVFGNNQWNVYAWNAGSGSLTTNNNWNTDYSGYYSSTALAVNNTLDWNPSLSPSAASGYVGCRVASDNFSFAAKRQGFPCGKYLLSIQNHRDAMQLLVNDVNVFEHDGCCDNHTAVWTGVLGANDKVEFRVTSGTGLSLAQMSFSAQPLGSTFTVSACNSYTWAAKGNKVYTASNNTDTAIVQTANGCDSIVTLNLTIYTTTNKSTTVSACNSYTWNGRTYTSSTVDTFSYRNGNGCLIVDTLKLSITGARRIYVNANATGANNGTSWTDAYTNLQTAINSNTGCNDTLWVAEGNYRPFVDSFGVLNPTDKRTRTFKLKPGLLIYGGFAGTESNLSERNPFTRQHITTIDGVNSNIPGDIGNYFGGCYHIFSATGSGNIVLDGLDIINANGFGSAILDQNGGGIYAKGVSMDVRNCRFVNNQAIKGCAIYGENATLRVSNSIMSGNLSGGYGGGVYTTGPNGSLFMINTLVSGNYAYSGGAVFNESGGETKFINCTFASNRTISGGSFLTNVNNSPYIQNCIIWGNVSEADMNRLIDRTNSFPSLSFCTMQANYPGFDYYGNYCDNDDPLFIDPKVAGVDSGGNYQLQECSSAIDRAFQSLNNTALDAAGNPRSYNAYYFSRVVSNTGIVSDLDRGAYDYQAPISIWRKDNDGDGYGDPGGGFQSCSAPAAGWVRDATDCNDNDAQQRPGQVWYKDADSDGYGETGTPTITQCLRPAGYRSAAELTNTTGDCDDTNSNVNPGRAEICGNGIDDNCDGIIDFGTGLTPDISATGTTSFCKGDSVLLTSNYVNGNVWNTGDTTQTIWAKRNQNHWVTITANGCAKTSDTIAVNYISTYGNNNNYAQTVCENTPITVNVKSVAGNTYSWSPATGLSATNVANPTVTISTNAQYILTESTPQGCVTNDTINLTPLGPLAVPSIAASFNSCSTAVRLNASSSLAGVTNVMWSYNGQPVKTVSRIPETVVNASSLFTGNLQNNPQFIFLKVKPDGKVLTSFTILHTVKSWVPFSDTGITVAGGNGSGTAFNQLRGPRALAVDKNDTVYVADNVNFRILKFAPGSTNGEVVAGGNGQGNALNQLSFNVVTMFLDGNKNLYIPDLNNHRVVKWAPGATQGELVAGGNGQGNNADQLNSPYSVAINSQGKLYIAEASGRRISIWTAGATLGTTFLQGDGTNALSNKVTTPRKVMFDKDDNLYVLDNYGGSNYRIQRFAAGDTIPTTIYDNNDSDPGNPDPMYDFDLGTDSLIYIVKGRRKTVERGVYNSEMNYQTVTPGTYTLSVTNIGGCVTTSAPYEFNGPIYTTDTIAACGAVTWHGKTYNAPGTYYDTLTGSAGCDSVARLVLQLAAPAGFTSITSDINPICTNDSFTLRVNGVTGLNPTITWRTKSIADTGGTFLGTGLTVRPRFMARTYYAVVRSDCGDLKEDSIRITQRLSSTYSVVQPSCVSPTGSVNNIVVSGGVSPYSIGTSPSGSYAVSTAVTGLRPAPYRIYIRDAAGCTGFSDVIRIERQQPLQISYTRSNVTCFNAANGAVTNIATANGKAPYSYTFNPANAYQAVSSFNNLKPGNYRLYVKDSLGCKAFSDIITITQPAAINVTFTKSDILCGAPTSGSITVTGASGGSGSGYRFALNAAGPFTTNNSFTGLRAGNYRIFIQDGSGCVVPGNVINILPCTIATRVGNPNRITDAPTNTTDISIYPNPTTGRFTLVYKSNAVADAAITISNSVGQSLSNRSVRLIKGSNNIQLDLGNQPAGMYWLRITTKEGVVVKMVEKGR